MNMISTILILILTVVLWRTYHKIFTVVYVNVAVGLLREIVICFIIAVFIVGGVLYIVHPSSSKKQEKNTNQSSVLQTLLGSEETGPDITGNFYNLALLEGNGVDVWINLEESESMENGITIMGFGFIDGYNYVQNFTIDVAWPEGNHFTCYDEWHSSTLDFTFNPDDHIFEIVQSSTDPDVPEIYTGTYVDHDVWDSMLDEIHAAKQAAAAAIEPQYWIKEYFGNYILTSFAEGQEDALYLWFELYENRYGTISMSTGLSYPSEYQFDYEFPYPKASDEVGHIHCDSTLGPISFDILDDAANGKHQIKITEFPYPQYIGTYIDQLDEIDPRLGNSGKLLKWDGTYVCQNGDTDGIKSITVAQADDYTLTIDMAHTYEDGREDSYYAVAEIDEFGNGPYFAAHSQEKVFTLTLEEDPNTKEKIITVRQVGIYPAIDLEYDGIYIEQ